jgi:hypothetical protein
MEKSNREKREQSLIEIIKRDEESGLYVDDEYGIYMLDKSETLTIVHKGDAAYGRKSYLTIEDDKVWFDCSDGEYGPISFPLQTLIDAIKLHTEDE